MLERWKVVQRSPVGAKVGQTRILHRRPFGRRRSRRWQSARTLLTGAPRPRTPRSALGADGSATSAKRRGLARLHRAVTRSRERPQSSSALPPRLPTAPTENRNTPAFAGRGGRALSAGGRNRR
jgi:hypothetical protein